MQRCPAMLVFDRHSLRCVVPPTEECDIPTTPLPLDGDGDNNVSGGQLSKDEQERKVSTVFENKTAFICIKVCVCECVWKFVCLSG